MYQLPYPAQYRQAGDLAPEDVQNTTNSQMWAMD
jgi:hypothetical protein